MKLNFKAYALSGYYINLMDKEDKKIGLEIDEDIAEYLDISYKKYIKILKKHNAYLEEGLEEMIFKNKSDAENAIKELESYLILTLLTN